MNSAASAIASHAFTRTINSFSRVVIWREQPLQVIEVGFGNRSELRLESETLPELLPIGVGQELVEGRPLPRGVYGRRASAGHAEQLAPRPRLGAAPSPYIMLHL